MYFFNGLAPVMKQERRKMVKTIKYFIVVLALALQSQSISAQDTKIGI